MRSTGPVARGRRLHGRRRPFAQAVTALTQPGARAVVIVTGRPGVGRSAFLDAIVDDLTENRPVIAVSGRAELSEVPLGALAPLLAELSDGRPDSTGIVEFHRAAAEPGTVIVVDDADLLDPASLCVLEQAIASRTAPVLISRAELPGLGAQSADIARLLGHASTRLDLAPLTAAESFALVKDQLGPAVGSAAAEEMHRLAAGSTRTLAALVDAASAAIDLCEPAAGWRTSWPYLSGEVVASLPADPFAAEPVVADLLSLLAVAGEVPVEQAGTSGASERATRLAQAAGFVTTRHRDGRVWAALAHPLYGPVMASTVSEMDRPGFCAAGADMIDGYPEHRVRHAMLKLAAGQPVEPSVLVRLANGELGAQRYSTAITLGEHATTGAGDDAVLRATGEYVQAQALSQIGGIDAASVHFDAAWAAIEAEGADDAFLTDLALAEGNHLAFRTMRPERALARAEEALARVTDPAERARIDVESMKWRVMAGEGGTLELQAIAALGAVETPGDLNLLILTATLQTMGGNLALAEEAVERGLGAADRFRDALPNARDLLQLSQVMVLSFTGRFAEARAAAREHLAECEESNPSARGIWRFALALIELHTGSPTRAWALIGEGRRDLVWRDVAGLLPAADALSAAVAARTGRFAIARSWLDQVAPAELTDPKAQLYAALARAWVSSSAARPGHAIRTLAPAVDSASASGHRFLAALVGYEAVRIDPVVGAAVMLPHLSTVSEAFPMYEAHARAVLARQDVLPIAKELADAGLLGPAIDAARWVADSASSDQARSSRARRLADSWTVRTGVSIAPQRRAGQPRVTPLTDREWQLASGAAAHRTSAELAAEYGISVRTVDNHLSRIYKKLGITGRRELSAQLGGLQIDSPFS